MRLAVNLVRKDLKSEASEGYKGLIIRSSVYNEAVKCNSCVCEEKARRFPHRYIESVKSPDGHILWSNREIRETFRVHFHDRFARWSDLTLQESRSNLADFPRLQEAEAAACKGSMFLSVRKIFLYLTEIVTIKQKTYCAQCSLIKTGFTLAATKEIVQCTKS